MKFTRKILPIVLLVAILLAGCGKSSDGNQETSGAPLEPPAVSNDAVRIVISRSAEAELVNLAGRLQNACQDEWGIEVPIVTDLEAAGSKDIFFGSSLRSTPSNALIDDADFLMEFSPNGGVIAGNSNYALESAVQAVVRLFRNGDYSNMQTLSYHDSVSNPRKQPVGHFSFSEADGNSVADSVAGASATLVNATKKEGIYGNGVFLNDDSNGYVDLGKGYVSKLLNGSEAVTLNLWIMAYQNRVSRLFSFYCDKTRTLFYCTYREGSLEFYARSTSGDTSLGGRYTYSADDSEFTNGTNGMDADDTVTNAGLWQMLTFVVDFKNDKVTVYVNGKQIQPDTENTKKFGSDTLVAGKPVNNDTIGGDPAVECFSFIGLIDEVSFYNCKLTAQEVKTLSHARTDRNSPVYDEGLLRQISARLGSDAALALNTNLYCSDGYQNVLDPSDYSKTSVMQNGVWMVPAAFAISYFSVEAVNGCELQDGYYSLEALCQAAGKRLLISETYGIAMVTNQEAWSEETDGLYLARLYRLMTEFSYELPTSNTEQSRVLIAEADGNEIRNCFGPYVFIHENTIYALMDNRKRTTFVFTSTDGGKTFQRLCTIPSLAGGSLFELNGVFYILGTTGSGNAQIGVTKSTDKGKTWSAITTIPYDVNIKYCIPSTVIHANGRVYKAYEGFKSYDWTEDKRAYVVSAPDNANLLDPNVWTVSSHYSYGIDDLMKVVDEPFYTDKTYIEEGCLVLMPDGTIRDVIRIDCFPHYGNAVSMRVSADGKNIIYNANDPYALINIPTGADLFHIEYDAVSGYYISMLNIKTTDYRPYQRNVLALAVSKDLKDWEVVTTLLVDRSMMNEYISMMKHGFQYVHFAFDGDDLVYVVREAMDDSANYHDNNYFTFYRLENFRSYIKD